MPGKPKGLPKTGGRVKGSKNKSTLDIRDILDKNVDFHRVVQKLQELADGVTMRKASIAGDIIYTEKPNEAAAKILLEYRFGKAKQSVDVTSGGETIVPPKVGIVNPNGGK